MQQDSDFLQNQLITLVNSQFIPSALLRPSYNNSGILADFILLTVNKSGIKTGLLPDSPDSSFINTLPDEISGELFQELKSIYEDHESNSVMDRQLYNMRLGGARVSDFLVFNWLENSAGNKQGEIESLKTSNEELEQFAYIASHDLQEPLRMVISFTQLLQKRYAANLDKDANEFIDYAVDGAKRMKELIDTLLQYSRISSKQPVPVKINTEYLVNEVLRDLSELISDTGVKVYLDNLPEVFTEKTLLKLIFTNLISNAVKYRAKNSPEVKIIAERKGKAWLFSVSDNGIGIDHKYFDKIFLIFNRLHGRNTYPGTGIGLAVCKKSVEKLGGRIWVESAPNKGSVFYFTIPETE